MDSLLSGIKRERIGLDPFPHVVARNVLPDPVFDALRSSFPPFSVIGWAGTPAPPSNRRYQMSAAHLASNPRVAPIWRDFTRLHSSPEFFAQVAALFAGHWPRALLGCLGGRLTGHAMGRLHADSFADRRILQDARPEINTPVTGPASVSRGPHLDQPSRLFTCLFYLRAAEDDSVGGALELFRWKAPPPAELDVFAFPDHLVERVAEIPYLPNQMVIFPQGVNALHGVGLRQPTPHTRQYVFISAELSDPWLDAGPCAC